MQKLDLVVYGATSFVGVIICQYLQSHLNQQEQLRWAMAGRSLTKLTALRSRLGKGAEHVPLIVAEANDEAALKSICDSTKVVLSTVGPYALYGETLLKTCVSSGTDYCDLTGEPQWIAKMLRRYESIAKISGARIVHSCGFDSVPSDLGVYQLQQHAIENTGQPCSALKMRVVKMQGAFSGGTLASAFNVLKEASASAKVRRQLANPYSLCPADHGFHAKQFEQGFAHYDSDLKAWTAPFMMAAINTRIVHRSNALQNNAYGACFTYEEAILTGQSVGGATTALAVSVGLTGFAGISTLAPARWLMQQVLPKPGEGPSDEAQQKGFYRLRFVGKSHQGELLQAQIDGDRDPGYGSTAKIISQAAICLCNNEVKHKGMGGFWTPASLFGSHLIARLEKYAGVSFSCPL